jgi:hypothetical protein
MPHLDWTFVALGAVGGLLPDLIRFVKDRQKGFPDWFRKVGYWVGLLLLVVLGGFAAWLGGAKTWQAALAMGYAAPEIISRLVGSDSPDLRGFGGFSLRKWWAK